MCIRDRRDIDRELFGRALAIVVVARMPIRAGIAVDQGVFALTVPILSRGCLLYTSRRGTRYARIPFGAIGRLNGPLAVLKRVKIIVTQLALDDGFLIPVSYTHLPKHGAKLPLTARLPVTGSISLGVSRARKF